MVTTVSSLTMRMWDWGIAGLYTLALLPLAPAQGGRSLQALAPPTVLSLYDGHSPPHSYITMGGEGWPHMAAILLTIALAFVVYVLCVY